MNARGRTQFAPTEKDRECEILCPFLHVLQARYSVLHLIDALSAVMSLPCVKGGGSRERDGGIVKEKIPS